MASLRRPAIAPPLLAVLLLAACSKDAPPPVAAPAAPPEVVVKIGHVAPMTGPQAHLGKDNENGAVMAIDELNAQHLEIGGAKVKFQLLAEDDQADPKQGTLVAQKFVDEKVNGVVGHLNSGTTIPASKIYFDAAIPQISGSATGIAYTQQGFNTAFRVMVNDAQQGQALGQFAVARGFRKIAVIDDRTAYGQGLADEFVKAVQAGGAAVVTTEYTNDKATDFKAILTKIKSLKPDLVFFGGMDAQGGPMLKQFKELGVQAAFLTGDGGCTPTFIELSGDAAEGQFCSLPGVPLEKMPKGEEFRAKYTAKFKMSIQLYAPYVYDATMVMVDAMKRANSVDPLKYLPELPKTDYQGVSSRIQFDEKGDLKSSAVSVYQVKDGKWQYVETIGSAPEAPAAPASAPVVPVVPAAAK
jgi:branched-chain amino acid transport system substrate-binding protein